MSPVRTIVVTGGDEGFASMLLDCVGSIGASGVLREADLGVLDQGLSEATATRLREDFGARLVRPEWPDFVPGELRQERMLGLTARPFLRDLFPGYDVYVWFDADAWAQGPEFLTAYVEGARASGAAVAQEVGPGYRKRLIDRRWWVGNMALAFGPVDGVRLSAMRSVNIGLIALTASAPHWELWRQRYRTTIERTGKINLDQHAFHAAVHDRGVSTTMLDAIDNWLPLLSLPVWEPADRTLREPGGAGRRLHVVHLAGPDKGRSWQLPGGPATPLTWSAVTGLG